jgi:hypothetical protein
MSSKVEVRRELIRRVTSLHLEAGDVILVSDPDLMQYFMEVEWPESIKKLRVPIVFAPEGLEKVPFEQLEQVYKDAKSSKQLVIV